MKIRHVIVLCLILGTGVLTGRAQGSSNSSPFVLAVTNISSTSVLVWKKNSAVSFRFTAPGVVKVDELENELAKNGVKNKRLVRIISGDQIVAEGRLIGTVNSSLANGFILAFDFPEAAGKAAETMKERGTLFPKPVDDRIGDYPPFWGDPSRLSRAMSRFRAIPSMPFNTALEPTPTAPSD
jgi:hypothetical protein